MLLNSVVIVLREVLEAALMLSVLLATSRFVQLKLRWVTLALVAGFLGAAAYGTSMHPISDLFDGVGQEIVNASLQFLVFAILAVCIFLIARRVRRPTRHDRALPIIMATAVALAIVREGSEILIYVSGFWRMSDFFSSVGVGSLVGVCIGLSVGTLFYYLLLSQPRRRALPLSVFLLSLIGAGMCGQATGLLIQADWLSVPGPLWNTSALLPEESLPGQLLYALIGYEASPSAKEVAIYVSSLAVMAVAIIAGAVRFRDRDASTS